MTPEPTMLPPGDYLIIDPCHILERTRFLALMDAVRAEGFPIVMTDPQTGAWFAVSYTATGDGTYEDQDGHLYGVDSGTLACLPLAMLDGAQLVTLPLHDQSVGQVCCGRMVTLARPSPCLPCDAHGVIRFGPMAIQTGRTWADIQARAEGEDL